MQIQQIGNWRKFILALLPLIRLPDWNNSKQTREWLRKLAYALDIGASITEYTKYDNLMVAIFKAILDDDRAWCVWYDLLKSIWFSNLVLGSSPSITDVHVIRRYLAEKAPVKDINIDITVNVIVNVTQFVTTVVETILHFLGRK